ncbi:hypothetical protein H8356DRAFT_1341394 [Neocallimastix lanati (nom. inval.)]|nr:hypothetical protein H8356DRAFT_1341394 [Neocallimastix sp. JGI-2020a]
MKVEIKNEIMEDINNYHSQRVYFLIVLLKYVESKKLIFKNYFNKSDTKCKIISKMEKLSIYNLAKEINLYLGLPLKYYPYLNKSNITHNKELGSIRNILLHRKFYLSNGQKTINLRFRGKMKAIIRYFYVSSASSSSTPTEIKMSFDRSKLLRIYGENFQNRLNMIIDKLKRIKLLEEDKIFYTCSALNSGILDINFTITYKYKTFDDLQ